jgi:hypothetical protein
MAPLKTSSIMENSQIGDLVPPVGIVCHDAGGANQVLAMCDEPGLAGALGYMEGPARNLWQQAFPGIDLAGSLAGLLSGIRTLVTGTGWASDLEFEARELARQQGIRSIAVLDHWTNYRARFERRDSVILPDELWVVDGYALQIARQAFPGLSIRMLPDRYAERAAARIGPVVAAQADELLYLLEPARSDWGRGEPGEFQALRYFLDLLPHLGLPSGTTIRLRPHPSDPPGKYDAFLGEAGRSRILPGTGDLTQALSRARWVAGCQTYAMTLALRAGRTVYCSLPPWAPACVLPHAGLVHLKDMFEE